MNFLKKLVWPAIVGPLKDWLQNRALVLPASKVSEIARRLNLTEAQVIAVDNEIIAFTVAALDTFKP